MNKTFALTALLAGCAFATTAQAATKTDQFDVTIKITANCFITADDIAFADSAGVETSTAVNAAGALHVRCTNGSPYTLKLSGTVGARAMTRVSGGTQTIAYELYSDSARTTAWGSTAGAGGNVVTGTGTGLGTGNTRDVPVYAKATLTGLEPAADYKDTVTATVEF